MLFHEVGSFLGLGLGLGFAAALAVFYAFIPLYIISLLAEFFGFWPDATKSLAEHAFEGLPGIAPFRLSSFMFVLLALSILARMIDFRSFADAKRGK